MLPLGCEVGRRVHPTRQRIARSARQVAHALILLPGRPGGYVSDPTHLFSSHRISLPPMDYAAVHTSERAVEVDVRLASAYASARR